jgi:hypothetical protein
MIARLMQCLAILVVISCCGLLLAIWRSYPALSEHQLTIAVVEIAGIQLFIMAIQLYIMGENHRFFSRRPKLVSTCEVDQYHNPPQIRFYLFNRGNRGLEADGAYWHVFLPAALGPITVGQSMNAVEFGHVQLSGDQMIHYSGSTRLPLFPGRRGLMLEIFIPHAKLGKHEVLYFLSTAEGLFPESVKSDESNGTVVSGYGKLSVHIKTSHDLA